MGVGKSSLIKYCDVDVVGYDRNLAESLIKSVYYNEYGNKILDEFTRAGYNID
jgi:hypothetical protein